MARRIAIVKPNEPLTLNVKRPYLAMVKWRDAFGCAAWHSESEARDWFEDRCSDFTVESVGYVIHKDERGVMLAATHNTYKDSDTVWGSLQFVPANMVIEIRRLK